MIDPVISSLNPHPQTTCSPAVRRWAWLEEWVGHLSHAQLKVMSTIERRRTTALGGHIGGCEDCCDKQTIDYGIADVAFDRTAVNPFSFSCKHLILGELESTRKFLFASFSPRMNVRRHRVVF
jgi:hypothetical protein